ncbi:DoxX family protein [Mucilaginibacter sp. CSA2-8R]|uniref:DoxX family protein n=1 Tax=Mucilaginibacter sp. CSA2-8R TaxID=3141542 RepID=UPI00315D0C33
MEAALSAINKPATSKTALWAGRIISGLCVLFLLFDAVCKIIKEQHAISGSAALGIPVNAIPGIGFTLLICTLLYALPRTAVWGAILLTGYLGGAMAIMMRAGQPVYFALVFGLLVWLGLYLVNNQVRGFLK